MSKYVNLPETEPAKVDVKKGGSIKDKAISFFKRLKFWHGVVALVLAMGYVGWQAAQLAHKHLNYFQEDCYCPNEVRNDQDPTEPQNTGSSASVHDRNNSKTGSVDQIPEQRIDQANVGLRKIIVNDARISEKKLLNDYRNLWFIPNSTVLCTYSTEYPKSVTDMRNGGTLAKRLIALEEHLNTIAKKNNARVIFIIKNDQAVDEPFVEFTYK